MPFLNWNQLARLESAPGRAIRMVDGDQGTLLRLECDGPTELEPHVHRETEQISVVLDGEMEFRLGDEVRTVRPGDVILVPVGVLHGMSVKEGRKALAVEFFTPPRQDLRDQMRAGL
jgi:quercetin dioxygenase-like cupin family protein